MKIFGLKGRTLALLAVIMPLIALFIYVAIRSGPLAPIEVTVTTVESSSISPSLFGLGTVQARYTYKIGPTFAGRVKHLDVHVGDRVEAGQVLGEMDAVDLDDRIIAQEAAIKSAEAAVTQAQAQQTFAKFQASRYEKLYASRATSEESAAVKRHELNVANSTLAKAKADVSRLEAELQVWHAQRNNLRLIAPVAGLVMTRDADPGTTVVAGQAVVEVIEPSSLWIDARFDQISANGLDANLPTKIALRSRQHEPIAGHVMRIEPQADVITEETLAKVVFAAPPTPLPPVGELAEVTVQLPELPASATIPNAAIRSVDGKRGVWKVMGEELSFVPLSLGRSDLNGQVQVLQGLEVGDRVIVYSDKVISAKSRIKIADSLNGATP